MKISEETFFGILSQCAIIKFKMENLEYPRKCYTTPIEHCITFGDTPICWTWWLGKSVAFLAFYWQVMLYFGIFLRKFAQSKNHSNNSVNNKRISTYPYSLLMRNLLLSLQQYENYKTFKYMPDYISHAVQFQHNLEII